MTDSKIQLFSSLIGNVNKTDIATSSSEAVGATLPEFNRVLNSAGSSFKQRKESGKDAMSFPELERPALQRNVGLRNSTTTTVSQGAKAKIEQKMEKAKLKAEELPANIDEVMASVNSAISETVCEQLNIEPEELEEALMRLGLNVTDLLDPSNMAKLFVYFKPQMAVEDVIMDADFMNLVDVVKENTQVVLEEAGIDVSQFEYILQNVGQKRPELLFPAQEVVEQNALELPPEAKLEVAQEVEVVEVADEQAQVQKVATQQMTGEEPQQNVVAEAEPQTQAVQVEVVKTAEPQQTTVNTEDVVMNPEEVTEEVAQVVSTPQEQTSGEETEEGAENDRLAKLFEKKPEKENGFEHKPMEHAQVETTRVETQTVVTPEGTTVTEQSVRVVDLQNLVTEVTNYIRMQSAGTELSSIEMQLTPANLGKVLVEVVSNQGEITARIATQTEAAKEAMESNLVQLKDNLESQGIKVNAVEVTVESHGFEENLQEDGSKEQEQLQREMQKQNRRLNLNLNEMTLEDIEGLMTEEEMVVAKMMKDNGNTLNISV
ncbi:MAG: hypothetical protein E7277_05560 [Lachnospiraceae bacterium]|jgi:flagellar hook-length control protein FliK|nr:hypothetical protein [Lachnospiraceae bacterium]